MTDEINRRDFAKATGAAAALAAVGSTIHKARNPHDRRHHVCIGQISDDLPQLLEEVTPLPP